jgi:hypothetical protein
VLICAIIAGCTTIEERTHDFDATIISISEDGLHALLCGSGGATVEVNLIHNIGRALRPGDTCTVSMIYGCRVPFWYHSCSNPQLNTIRADCYSERLK